MSAAVDIDGISAGWLSQTLGYPVHSVDREKVGTGQTGASYRLTLDADKGPVTLLAKVAAGDLEARRRVAGGYRAEVGFYGKLADSVAIRTPECRYAAISEDSLHFTLLLEYLSGYSPGVQVKGCSPGAARGAVGNLAALHAPRWNDPELYDLDFLLGTRGQRPADYLGALARSATDSFVRRYRSELGAEDTATMLAAGAAIEEWLMAAPRPFTVLHGDYRLDNLMFGGTVDDVVALDWQTAAVGSPTRDLAYFLGTCLEPGQRRESEAELVTLYHSEICARGVEGYTLDSCFRDYRRDQLQASLITSIGCIHATGIRSPDSDRMFLAMARRSCAAIRDLGTLEL